jgi:hypothetical protein
MAPNHNPNNLDKQPGPGMLPERNKKAPQRAGRNNSKRNKQWTTRTLGPQFF